MSKQPLEFDDSKSRLAALVGGIIAFVALFFPLFTVTYNPPGGSAIIDGHRIYAFVDPISGWEFANSAAYFKLLPAIVILFSLAGLGSILLWLPFNVVKQTLHQVQSYLSAFVHIVISLGWLLVLFSGYNYRDASHTSYWRSRHFARFSNSSLCASRRLAEDCRSIPFFGYHRYRFFSPLDRLGYWWCSAF